MILRSLIQWAVIVFGVSAIASPGLSQTLYGADGAQGNLSTLYILDPVTGEIISEVGPIGFAVTGMAVHPMTGVVFGVTSKGRDNPRDPNASPFPANLITIDLDTGSGTRIGPVDTGLGSDLRSVPDVTFTLDGKLIGFRQPPPFPETYELVEIDLSTGLATAIGDSGLGTVFGAAIATAPDGTIVFAGTGDTPDPRSGADIVGVLHTIDPDTGAILTELPLIGGDDPNDPFRPFGAGTIDDDGKLFVAYMANGTDPRTADLATIDRASGAITTIGPTVDRLDAIAFIGPVIEPVDIDIKPGSFPNSINLGSGGATPVAILGSAELDVNDIDPDTLTLGTAGIKTVGRTDRLLCSVDDVSGDFSSGLEGAPDGFDDLVCHFITFGIVPEQGDTLATLSGELLDDTRIKGSDSVNIVP